MCKQEQCVYVRVRVREAEPNPGALFICHFSTLCLLALALAAAWTVKAYYYYYFLFTHSSERVRLHFLKNWLIRVKWFSEEATRLTFLGISAVVFGHWAARAHPREVVVI